MPSNQDAQRPRANDLAEETAKAVQLTKDLADFDRYLRETSENASQLRSLPDEADVTRVISTGKILDRNGRELRAIVERGEPLDPDDVQSLCSMLTHAQRLRQDVSQYSILAPATCRLSQTEIASAVRAAEAIEVLVTSVFERAGIDPTPVLLRQNPDLERTAWIRLAGSLQAARLVRSEGSKKAGFGADTADTADTKADTERKTGLKIPQSHEVLRLIRALSKPRSPGVRKIDLAKEIVGQDERRANNLLRQARHYKHLWQGQDAEQKADT